MARPKIFENARAWKTSGKTMDVRVKEAYEHGNVAKKIFDNPAIMPRIIAAIDSESKTDFTKACQDAGINDADMITRMWDATMGSLSPQSMKPCW